MQTVYLSGSETVQSAASTISSAAHDMRQVAMNFDGSVQDLKRFMDDWLIQFRDALENHAKAILAATQEENT